MKFLHLSDTHFDYSPAMNLLDMEKYSKEKYNAFQKAIDYAKEHDIKLIVHSGDVFDRINPKLIYIHDLMRLLYTGTREGITFLIVSGNHDQPKIKDTFNPLGLFEAIEGINIYTSPGIFTFENVDFFCIPSPKEWSKVTENFPSILSNLFEEEKNRENQKVLVSHIQIFDVKDKSTDEIEPFIVSGLPPEKIPKEFQYVALGHVHKMQQIRNRPEMWYAGSLTPLSFNEIGQKKYFIEVEINKKEPVKINPIEMLSNYALIETKINVESITSEEDIENSVEYYTKNIDLNNNILKIIFTNATDVFYKEYDAQKLSQSIKKRNVLGFKVEIKRKEESLEKEFNKIDLFSKDLIKTNSAELAEYLKQKGVSEEDMSFLFEINSKIISGV
jgi:DNA repair exonuclease SbcCD nuclease subunit